MIGLLKMGLANESEGVGIIKKRLWLIISKFNDKIVMKTERMFDLLKRNGQYLVPEMRTSVFLSLSLSLSLSPSLSLSLTHSLSPDC